ncbi:MAG: PEP-utilizing enzyme [Patescibacteria group bacterium]
MKFSDYYNFEFQMLPYFNEAYGNHSPQTKYRGEYINGNWYLKYVLNGNSPALVPKDSWVVPGRRFLGWLLENDSEFTDHIYSLSQNLIVFTEKLEKMNYEDMKSGRIRPQPEFYYEYIKSWSLIIGFGYPLDMALDEYLKAHPIDVHVIPSYGNSFIREEEKDLKKIAFEKDPKKAEDMLLEHSYKYSYVLSNYAGYHPASLEYFRNRLAEIRGKNIPIEIIVPMKKPDSLEGWVGLMTYIRDVRKKCNMIYNAMADRYLREECKKLNLNYEDAVFLQPAEFEAQKNTGIRKFNGIRYMEVTNHGQVDLDEKVWDSLITEGEGSEVTGVSASKGRVKGTVKIVLGRADFHKMQRGDILVTSMTRPDFVPVLNKCGAIVTNEGGVTCHAAIISREMNIPCIIGTKNATKILKDGDMVEVDAEKGIVKIIK